MNVDRAAAFVSLSPPDPGQSCAPAGQKNVLEWKISADGARPASEAVGGGGSDVGCR